MFKYIYFVVNILYLNDSNMLKFYFNIFIILFIKLKFNRFKLKLEFLMDLIHYIYSICI